MVAQETRAAGEGSGEAAPVRTAFPDILTPEQAAAYLQVSVSMILAKARAGLLPAIKLGREWRFSRRRLLRWVEEDYVPETWVDAALLALAEERIAEAGEDDGIPWEEVERSLQP